MKPQGSWALHPRNADAIAIRPPPKLLDQVRVALRTRHYSPRTETAYVAWIRRFILFHQKRHPAEMGEQEINAFVSDLAVRRRVAAPTQTQALSAILFLYRKVLGRQLDWVDGVVRASRPRRLPTVPGRSEVKSLLSELRGRDRLMAALLYGAGLRLMECLRLRVKDIDLERGEITVRQGKGDRDRVTVLPSVLKAPLAKHLEGLRREHREDVRQGLGVSLPHALARKYPNASHEWAWWFIFPAARICTDPRFGGPCRHHLHESALQRSVKMAARRAGLIKPVGCHSFRHAFATHLLEDGYDIRTVQELLGHQNVRTTMVYTHVLNRGGLGVRSPADRL